MVWYLAIRTKDFHKPRFNDCTLRDGKHSMRYFDSDHIYSLDWTVKSKTNLAYNLISPTYDT